MDSENVPHGSVKSSGSIKTGGPTHLTAKDVFKECLNVRNASSAVIAA